jgi:hypothetical protein
MLQQLLTGRLVKWSLVLSMSCFFYTSAGQVQWSSWYVFYGEGGKLQYRPDETGDIIPDYSHVGYHYGDDTIPGVSVVVELSPSVGDDGATIQAAIESLASRSPYSRNARRLK